MLASAVSIAFLGLLLHHKILHNHVNSSVDAVNIAEYFGDCVILLTLLFLLLMHQEKIALMHPKFSSFID